MLGAVAAGAYASLGETMASMSALGRATGPSTTGVQDFHRRKRKVYELLRGLDRGRREAMLGFNAKSG
jgi:D-ribulokinase